MQIRRWISILGLLAVGGILGAAAILASVQANEWTSTDSFCTSCHTMASLAADPHFQQSAHLANAAGVRPSCGDCHIPAPNWFVETYTHAVKGVKDVIAERTHDFSDPAVWEARRVELARFVRDEMRGQDSATCRSCHAAAAIHPASERGRAAHALLQQRRVTCIDCHFNLVHAPVPPSASFIRGSGLGVERK
jgi:cytochrome c-type protein NapC